MKQNTQNSAENSAQMKNRYIASMLLAAVGDAIGYRGGAWQFNYDGVYIHKDMMKLTKNQGVLTLVVEPDQFPYSDDTVMHIATARGLLNGERNDSNDKICVKVAKQYKQCMKFMSGRAPGGTCIRSAAQLKEDGSNWNTIKFSKNAGGCGASMRAACIGLYYYDNIKKLIEISIETGRTTHHHPIGYLGSTVAAYFTALAIRNVHPYLWYKELINEALPYARQYVLNNRQGEENIKEWNQFEVLWNDFAVARQMSLQGKPPVYPQNYDVKERQFFYKKFALSGWPGALGVDSVIISYDALLSSMNVFKKAQQSETQKPDFSKLWAQICLRGMLHGGDSDSTGTIVGAWYGAIYGLQGVPLNHYQKSEDRQIIENLGQTIFERTYALDSNNKNKSTILDQ